MAINWGALIPAAARGLGAYRAGQTQGEQERRADDVAASTRAFEEWAKRRALQLQEDKTAQLYQSQEATRQNNAAMLLERLRNAAEIAEQNNAARRDVAGTNAGVRRDVAGMQYGEGGAVDRTNASRENQVRITVDGANRRDDMIVELPGGGFGRVDAMGRVVPLPGKPYEKPTQARGAGTGGASANAEVNRMKSQYLREPEVKDAGALAGPVRQVKAALKAAPNNPQAQLSVVYETIRMMDPRTGVRPSETGLLMGDFNSLPERARSLVEGWNSGRRITPKMLQMIHEVVAEKEAAGAAALPPVQQRYGERLRRLGLEADSAYVAPSVDFGGAETPAQRRERLRRGG